MDGVPSAKDLIRHFFESSNEMLLSHSTAADFFYSLINMLDEELSFSPLLFHLPILRQRSVYATDQRLLELARSSLPTEVLTPDTSGSWLYWPLADLGPSHYMILSPELKNHAIFNTFCDLFAFYVRQIDRVDRLGARISLLRCQNLLKKAFEDGLPMAQTLDCLASSLRNEYVFLYRGADQKFFASEDTLKAIKGVKSALIPALERTLNHGDYIRDPEFHEDIKSLILYPLLLVADSELIIGSFSQVHRVINDLDFELICDFALDRHNMLKLVDMLSNCEMSDANS